MKAHNTTVGIGRPDIMKAQGKRARRNEDDFAVASGLAEYFEGEDEDNG